MKIVVIGAGNMAEAIVSGIVNRDVVDRGEICVTDIDEERLEHFVEQYGVGRSANNAAAAGAADVIVLAVKPQVFPIVWFDIKNTLKSDALVISIMAGISCAKIAEDLPIRVVRVMPNTPAWIGKGVSAIAAGAFAKETDLEIACKLMKTVGLAIIVKEEKMNAITALSGSGPAYVFYLIESMLSAASQMGLKKETSRELVLGTVMGAVELIQQTGEEPERLRNKVTSKGGTTEAAIATLEKREVKNSIVAALLDAQARSMELENG